MGTPMARNKPRKSASKIGPQPPAILRKDVTGVCIDRKPSLTSENQGMQVTTAFPAHDGEAHPG